MNVPDKRHQSFPLRLSPSLRQQAVDFAVGEGISLNHFISLAVAEKISRMDPGEWLQQEREEASRERLSIVPNPNRQT